MTKGRRDGLGEAVYTHREKLTTEREGNASLVYTAS